MKNTFRFKKVLFIDDDYIARSLLEKVLKMFNFSDEIVVCATGNEALYYLRVNSSSLPEIIFLDINIPEMDGFEFLESFAKLHERIKKQCHIIMLTSSTNEEDIKRAQENEYVRMYMTKPLTRSKLEEISIAFSRPH